MIFFFFIKYIYTCTIFIFFIFYTYVCIWLLCRSPWNAPVRTYTRTHTTHTQINVYGVWNIMTLSPCPEQTSDLFRAIETSSLRSAAAASLFSPDSGNVWKIHITRMNYNFFRIPLFVSHSRAHTPLSLYLSTFPVEKRIRRRKRIYREWKIPNIIHGHTRGCWRIYDLPRQPRWITKHG